MPAASVTEYRGTVKRMSSVFVVTLTPFSYILGQPGRCAVDAFDFDLRLFVRWQV